MKWNKKSITGISLFYGFIISLVNYAGFLIPSSGAMPVEQTESYETWLSFMDSHSSLITFFSVLCFLIPVILCILYCNLGKKSESRIKRFINLPIAFSAIGSLGWILSFILESIFLLIIKFTYKIEISKIVLSSLTNIIQEAIFIFTLGFLLMDLLHRKIVLPRIFPEGNLSQYQAFIKPSVRFIVIVFFLSVSVFPTSFLVSSFVTFSNNTGVTMPSSIYKVLAIIIVFGIVILITFCDYFNGPLKKLKTATGKIREGDFSHRVDIISNDSFGELAETFNDMTKSIDEKNKKILAIQDSVIRGMAVMVESRDNSTGGHINRTSDCVKIFAESLLQTEKYKNLSPDFYKAVIKAAPMHDLGKIAVDDA